jgi:ribosomal protein S6
MEGNKNQYQLILVLNPKIEDKENILKKITTWLETKRVKLNQVHLGLKELAYEIEKNSKGDFWVLDVTSESPIKLKEFNLLLNREPNIIRYLILKV